MTYALVVDAMAFQDIQEAIDYYEEQHVGLGEKFEAVLNKHLVSLEKNPQFQIRYDKVHCLPLKEFPYMVILLWIMKTCL